MQGGLWIRSLFAGHPDEAPVDRIDLRTPALVILAVLAVAHTAWLAREFLMPVALAVLFAVMLSPLVRRIERLGAPPALAAGIIVLAMTAVTVLLLWRLGPEALRFAQAAPALIEQVQDRVTVLNRMIQPLSQASEEVRQSVEQLGSGDRPAQRTVVVEGGASPLTMAMTSAGRVLMQTLFCLVLVFFLLAQRRRVKSFALHATPPGPGRHRLLHVFQDVKLRVARYLLAVTIINVGLGVAVSLALAAVGFPNPALWGALVALANYVPYAGPIVMQLATLAVGVVVFDTVEAALLPAALVWALNTIEGHVVTPWLVGRQVVLNPLSVFIAVAFGGWIWGVVGAIVAMPALIMVASVLQHWWPALSTDKRGPRLRSRGVGTAAPSIR